jgi:hypothetical protein
MNPVILAGGAGQVLNTIRSLVKRNQQLSGNVSLTDLTKVARVEPITIVSQDCVNLEYMPDILQSCQSLFAGYYLQSVSLIANVKGVKVAKILDRLNPSTDPKSRAWMYAFENYKFSLPEVEKPSITLENISLENESLKKPDPLSYNDKSTDKLAENVNLSVGKMFNVTIQQDDVKMTLPVSIRLLVNQVSEKSIISMLTLMGQDTTLKERWHAWRSGRISFWKDLVLASDLIKEAKKMMQNDKEGVITEIFQRSNNAKLSSVFGNELNLASASNIYVISSEVASQIEAKTGQKLSNFKAREDLLKSGYTMILVVVDKTWERVTFYHRGISLGTSVGIKDIKAGNKSGGPDVMEVMKAYMLGSQPPM